MAKLFREKSLERLNDPERLDQVFRIVSPFNWIILAIVSILLMAILIWSLFGTIATRVNGNGILVSHNQKIYDAVAQTEGQIKSVSIKTGDQVKKGQVLVELALPVLEIELKNKRQALDSLKTQLEELKEFIARDKVLDQKHLTVLLANWQKDLNNASQHLKYLKEAIEARQKLVSRGAISQQEMADLKSRYYKELQAHDAISNKMTEKRIEVERRVEQNQERIRLLRNKLLEAAHDVAALQRKLDISSHIKSPVNGHVIELIAKPGAIVKHGQRLVDIEGQAEIIDAAVYVPASEGKNIQLGMTAHIIPTTVKKQEFGSIVGKVTQVSRFPSSEAGMMGVLANAQLVKDFTKTGPQLFVRVDLFEANTPSGYQWTSSEGPDIEISNGTLCTAEVTVRSQAPVTLIIPALKNILGMD